MILNARSGKAMTNVGMTVVSNQSCFRKIRISTYKFQNNYGFSYSKFFKYKYLFIQSECVSVPVYVAFRKLEFLESFKSISCRTFLCLKLKGRSQGQPWM